MSDKQLSLYDIIDKSTMSRISLKGDKLVSRNKLPTLFSLGLRGCIYPESTEFN